MKKRATYILIATVIILGCQPDEIQPIGDPLSKKDGVIGDWKLSSVSQIDELAKASDENDFSKDVTELFSFLETEIEFNESSFVLNAGDSPDFVKMTDGNWSFDNIDSPTLIYLVKDLDTTDFVLSRSPREGFDLKVKYERYDDDELYLSYEYTFEKK